MTNFERTYESPDDESAPDTVTDALKSAVEEVIERYPNAIGMLGKD